MSDIDKAKRLFRELASEYQHTPDGLRALLSDPRWRSAFPTSQMIEPDKIALEVIDVLSPSE